MPHTARAPLDELGEFSRRSTADFARAFRALTVAKARRAAGLSWSEEHDRAMNRVARTIGETMALADLYGRRRVFLELDAAASRIGTTSFSASPVVPHVSFAEAVSDVVSREPRLAPSAEEVARLYRDRHAFALARSADESLTARVQSIVARALEAGETTTSAAALVREAEDFTVAYADTVYRTNLTTAYTAGRFQQAQEPVVRRAMPAMERTSVRDSAVRQGRPEDHGENHLAADGLVADTLDPIWRVAAPPSGYRCRCQSRLVSAGELRRRGLMDGDRVVRFTPRGFERFAPHSDFGTRSPGALVYGGT